MASPNAAPVLLMKNVLSRSLHYPPPIRARLITAQRAFAYDALPSLSRIMRAEAEQKTQLTAWRSECASQLHRLKQRFLTRIARRSARQREREIKALQQEAERKVESALAEGRAEMLELSLSIARSLVEVELSDSVRSLASRLNRCLLALPRPASAIQQTTVRVNPLCYQKLVEKSQANQIEQDYARPLLRSDPSIPIGDAVIDTASGTIALSWAHRFEQIAAKLRNSIAITQVAS